MNINLTQNPAVVFAPSEDAAEEPKKEKRTKPMSKKQLKKLQEKLEEQARLQALLEKQGLVEETKQRVQREWEFNKIKGKIFVEEHTVRLAQLKTSLCRISEISRRWNEYLEGVKKKKEWSQYMYCKHLPDPSSLPELQTYIFVWTDMEKSESMSYTILKTTEVMELLDGLDNAIDDPGSNCPRQRVSDWKKVRKEMRRLLQLQLDRTTYRILRRIEAEMIAVDVTTTKFTSHCQFFSFSLWAELMMPIPSTRATEVKSPLKVTFEEIRVTVVIPTALVEVQKAMRALWLHYDHWTDLCRSFDCPSSPEYYSRDIVEQTMEEFQTKTEIMECRDNEEQKIKRRIGRIPPEHTLSQELFAWQSEPQRVLSDEVAFQEGVEEEIWREGAQMKLNEFEVNLRKFFFLGGLLLLDVFYQPPQPKYLRFKHDVTLLTETAELHPVEFCVKYSPLESFIQEEKQTRGGRFEAKSERINEEFKKLVMVELTVSDNVLWFETPKVAIWDSKGSYWSTEDVHDVKFNDEDQVLQFRAGRLGIMGLFVNRYCNFPYQRWELAPDGNNGVMFSLTTAAVLLEFRIRGHQVCLSNIIGAPSSAMNWVLDHFYTPFELMKVMRQGGIDIFPPVDAACYIPNSDPKNPVAENHVYQIWGIFCLTFRFQFSKFNRIAGRRNMIFQTKEYNELHETKYYLIRTSPAEATVLDITEDHNEFSTAPVPNLKFYADMYNLIYDNCTNAARRKSESTDFLLVQTVRDLLTLIRPLSYS